MNCWSEYATLQKYGSTVIAEPDTNVIAKIGDWTESSDQSPVHIFFYKHIIFDLVCEMGTYEYEIYRSVNIKDWKRGTPMKN